MFRPVTIRGHNGKLLQKDFEHAYFNGENPNSIDAQWVLYPNEDGSITVQSLKDNKPLSVNHEERFNVE